jgi:hypothetical protein
MGWIYGMAESREDMKKRLGENSVNIIVHLLLVYFFPQSLSRAHWRGEIFGFIPSIKRFKGSHQFPDQGFIERHFYLWVIDSREVDDAFKGKVENEGLVFPGGYDLHHARAFGLAGRVLHEVSVVLAKDHEITKNRCGRILYECGL